MLDGFSCYIGTIFTIMVVKKSFNRRNKNTMNIEAYYERIGMKKPECLNKTALDEIILKHQCTIPFEDLTSNYLKEEVFLDYDKLFEKVITKKRGGYCFELNGLFKEFLCESGFDAYCCFAKVMGMERPIMHRGVIVKIDGELNFADVGFGGPMPPGAIKIVDGLRQVVDGETFWFEKRDGQWWALMRLDERGKEVPVILITLDPQMDVDFNALNYYCWSNPASRFVNVRLVNLRLPNGHYSITDDVFVKKIDGEKTEETIASDERFREILKEYFSIVL